MDKIKNNPLMIFKQSVFTKGILLSCLGLGLTGCSETRKTQFNPYAQAWGTVPSHQAAVYSQHDATDIPYVRVAQNNAAPGLRGPYQVRKAILGQYHFDDYPRHQSVSDTPAQAKTPSLDYYIPQAPVNAPSGYFQHHLEEATPHRVFNTDVPAKTLQEDITPAPVAAIVPPKIAPVLKSRAQLKRVAENFKPQSTLVESQAFGVDDFQPNYQGTGTSLNQSLDKALAQSSRLAIEDIRIQEAEEQLEQAKSQGRFRLNLDGTVGAGQNETDFRVIDRTDSDFRVTRSANLNLSLPLYQGGRINAQKDVAKIDVETAKANYQAVESDIAEQAGIAHLNVLRDRALVELFERNVALLQTQQNTVQALLNAGENTVTDQALVDARLASIQVRLKQSQSNLSASESRYKKLTGYAAPALSPIREVKLPASLQEAKEAAFSNNAELQAMQSEAESAFHNIRVAKSLSRPRLALQGNLRAAEGQSDTIQRSSAAEVLLNLSVPILSGGENKSRVRQAALEQSRAALEIRALQENLTERLEQLWAAVSAAQQSQAPNLAQKAAAETAYEAILLQRRSGVATSLDVLSIEQTLLDSELNIIQANNAEGVARLQILGLMGAL